MFNKAIFRFRTPCKFKALWISKASLTCLGFFGPGDLLLDSAQVPVGAAKAAAKAAVEKQAEQEAIESTEEEEEEEAETLRKEAEKLAKQANDV